MPAGLFPPELLFQDEVLAHGLSLGTRSDARRAIGFLEILEATKVLAVDGKFTVRSNLLSGGIAHIEK